MSNLTDALRLQLDQIQSLQSALEAAQREIADLRNRLNLSEKLQGRFPVDAVQPDPKAAEAVRAVGYENDDGTLYGYANHLNYADNPGAIPVRIMRESDYAALTARLSEQETLLAERNRDAERYRWLRNQYRLMSPHMDGNHHWAPKMAAILRGPSVDAAIDAAMGAKEGM